MQHVQCELILFMMHSTSLSSQCNTLSVLCADPGESQASVQHKLIV